MEIRWLTAFVDLPGQTFDAGVDFWEAVSGTTRSEPRGASGEFATLTPGSGDAHLRVQRADVAEARVHLDLHVDHVGGAVAAATALGGLVSEEFDGWVVMTSPGGFVFCFVGHHGEATVPAPLPQPVPHRVDQVSIDIPHAMWDTECEFWAELTGWVCHVGSLEEFAVLDRPDGIPMRVLLHRLGQDDAGQAVRAHLDLACGERRAEVAHHHRSLGATHVFDGPHWTTLRDPAGLVYCVTRRDPATAQLPD